MKRIYSIIVLFLGIKVGYCQDTTYFKSVENNNNAALIVYVQDAYQNLSTKEKEKELYKNFNGITFDFLMIHHGTKRELWLKETDLRIFSLLDSMDMNNPDLRKYMFDRHKQGKLMAYSWFVYFGMQSSFNYETFNLYLNARIGTFLLKNRWDAALSFSVGFNEDLVINLGFASKYYQPIKTNKCNFSLYVGLQVSYNFLSYWSSLEYPEPLPVHDWDISGLTGISFYIGTGSLDFGIQSGRKNPFMTTIGYTFSLNNAIKRKKKI